MLLVECLTMRSVVEMCAGAVSLACCLAGVLMRPAAHVSSSQLQTPFIKQLSRTYETLKQLSNNYQASAKLVKLPHARPAPEPSASAGASGCVSGSAPAAPPDAAGGGGAERERLLSEANEVALAAGKPVTPVAPAAPEPDASSPRRPPASQRVPKNNTAFAEGLQSEPDSAGRSLRTCTSSSR